MANHSNHATPKVEHRELISPEIISNILIYFKDHQTIKRAGENIYEFDPKKINNSDLNLLSTSVFKTLKKYIEETQPDSDITLGFKNLFDTHEGHECAYTVIYIEGKDSEKNLSALKEFAKRIAYNAIKVDDLISTSPAEISIHDDIKSSIYSQISSKSGSMIKRPFSFGSDLNNKDEEYTCRRFQTVTDRQESSDKDEYECLARPNGFNLENNKIYCTVFSKDNPNKIGKPVGLKCIDPGHFKAVASAYLSESFLNCKIKKSKNPYTNNSEQILISVSTASAASPDDFDLELQ